MKISDFFDPLNKEHIRAWQHLQEEGVWPKGFIPEGTTFDPVWHVALAAKIAQTYCDLLSLPAAKTASGKTAARLVKQAEQQRSDFLRMKNMLSWYTAQHMPGDARATVNAELFKQTRATRNLRRLRPPELMPTHTLQLNELQITTNSAELIKRLSPRSYAAIPIACPQAWTARGFSSITMTLKPTKHTDLQSYLTAIQSATQHECRTNKDTQLIAILRDGERTVEVIHCTAKGFFTKSCYYLPATREAYPVEWFKPLIAAPRRVKPPNAQAWDISATKYNFLLRHTAVSIRVLSCSKYQALRWFLASQGVLPEAILHLLPLAAETTPALADFHNGQSLVTCPTHMLNNIQISPSARLTPNLPHGTLESDSYFNASHLCGLL